VGNHRALITSVSVPGPYRVPNYDVALTAIYTNRVPVTPVAAPGGRRPCS